MLRHKDTVILSEIKGFFTTSEKAIETILCFMSSSTFSDKQFGLTPTNNLRYNIYSKFVLPLLFPFFDIQDASHYIDSALFKYISCGKDIFYRFINNSMIDWFNYGLVEHVFAILKHVSIYYLLAGIFCFQLVCTVGFYFTQHKNYRII